MKLDASPTEDYKLDKQPQTSSAFSERERADVSYMVCTI